MVIMGYGEMDMLMAWLWWSFQCICILKHQIHPIFICQLYLNKAGKKRTETTFGGISAFCEIYGYMGKRLFLLGQQNENGENWAG